MEYKVGDLVKIKSLEWYNCSSDRFGRVKTNGNYFTKDMSKHCGDYTVIESIEKGNVTEFRVSIDGNAHLWNEEMFECHFPHEEKPIKQEGQTYVHEYLIKEIAEVIKKNNLGVSVKEEDGRLIIEPLKVEEDLPIDTPCMCSDDIINWHLRYYYNKCSTYPNGLKSTDEELPQKWNYIVPFDRFNPNEISESLKYNIVK